MYFLSHISIRAFFLLFHLYFYKKFKLSVNAYLLLIYTFMCMIMLFLGFKPISTLVLTQGNAMLHICVFNEVQDTTKVSQIILLRIILLSFQSHQIRILSAGLGMAWNRDGLSWNRFYFDLWKRRRKRVVEVSKSSIWKLKKGINHENGRKLK